MQTENKKKKIKKCALKVRLELSPNYQELYTFYI